jgi:phosphoglycerate dehydrogenase-like enzyme
LAGVTHESRAVNRRVLVMDVATQSPTWAFDEAAERAVGEATPDGWELRIVRALTSSDGDGPGKPSAEALEAIRDAEVYVGYGITPPLFEKARTLKWVHSTAAGVRSALFPELVESDVQLTNSAGIHAVPIAETVVGGILHLVRGLDIAVAQQREGRWDKRPFAGDRSPLRELGDCRATVVGAGGLGSEIARRLAAFGTECVGVRRRVELGAPPGFTRVVQPGGLDGELPATDILVLTAPLTGETESLIDRPRLEALPQGAIVVNVARGALLDEGAVAELVEQGRLRGAVLDVFRHEPLAHDSPLWQLRSVLVLPHVSPVSPGRFWPRQLELLLDNWSRYRRGEPLRNLVDKRAGY